MGAPNGAPFLFSYLIFSSSQTLFVCHCKDSFLSFNPNRPLEPKQILFLLLSGKTFGGMPVLVKKDLTL